MGMKAAVAKPRTLNVAEILLRPFQEFVQAKTSSGLFLLACTIIALLWANSPWAQSYHDLWEFRLVIGGTGAQLELPLHLWINDGLMTIFFLLVGLEIKREMLVGELSQLRQALLPMMAAVGGVIFPAIIYTIWNWGGVASAGWGIPMATDIAFALGVLALLGKRIPLALKIFLAALAIVDDLIAVLTIALFYSGGINWLALGIGAIIFGGLLLCNVMGVRRPLFYAILGVLLWLAIFQSGIHATIAGVLLAFTIPVRSRIDAETFVQESRECLDEFEQRDAPGIGLVMDDRQQAAVQALETRAEAIQTPLQRIEHALHIPVSFIVIPLFVLANAGVHLDTGTIAQELLSPVALGVFSGLIIGKQMGITLFSWLVVKLGWAQLPEGVSWRHIYGVSWLGGIGFTMSLFVAGLAFTGKQAEFLNEAKVGVLLALAVAGGIGYLFLRSGKEQKANVDGSVVAKASG
jgi:NhaA family Na+:H+ antiporter